MLDDDLRGGDYDLPTGRISAIILAGRMVSDSLDPGIDACRLLL